MLKKCSVSSINVVNDCVERTDKMRCLGVWFDSILSFKFHVSEKCKIAFLNIRNIRSIRRFITVEICKVLVVSLVLSHINYCNALLYGLPDCTLSKLQRVQNVAAKLVLQRRRSDSSREALRELHWLPIKLRIEYKIATLVFKCVHDMAPSYLKDLLSVKVPSRALRSSDESGILFSVPVCSRKTFLDRSFAVSGPKVWNSLPSDIRSIDSIDVFKKQLKTFYFNQF